MGCLFLTLCVGFSVGCFVCFEEGMRNERNEMEDYGLNLKGWRV